VYCLDMTAYRLSRVLLAAALVVGSACVPGSATPDALPSAPAAARWPVKVQPHVDLWLHGFGMISTDTTPVPLFRRGYRDSMVVLRNRANVYTSLDANRDELASRLASTPALQNAQFLVFSFPTWAALSTAIETFIRVEGDPRRASDQTTAAEIAFLAAQFPTALDRTWLRRFHEGLVDEQRAFYQGFFTTTQRERSPVLDAVFVRWEETYRARFQRFLSATQQRSGEMLLSLPLGPEGRLSSGREGQTVVAVPMPGRVDDAHEAFSVFAHEVVGSTVGSAVSDNVTPAQQRSGESTRYVAFGQVRGGVLLLQEIAPELVAPYVRYYLRQGGHRVPSGATDAALVTALANAYPLPAPMLEAIKRQIDIALGGI
jgi:hypothetical protein